MGRAASLERNHRRNTTCTQVGRDSRIIEQFDILSSPRRSLISCAATKQKFTEPGLFLARHFSGTDLRQ